VGGVQCVHDQPGGDQHEDDTRDTEELGQVDAHAAPVDAVSQGDRHEDAEQRADTAGGAGIALVERGEQEHHGLEAFAQHRQERHRYQRVRRAGSERRFGGGGELTLEAARVAAHPHHHVRDHDDRHRADDRFEEASSPSRRPITKVGSIRPPSIR
jgi:hypothetical protein